MLFLNPWLLAGLAGVGIPILIHLVRRQAAKPVDWGAMRFLIDTLSLRRRKMEWEDLLLMAARCLLLGLLALAIARPFVTPDSQVPWLFVLPAGLLGIALFGGSFVLGGAKARWLVRLGALGLLLAAAGLVVFEKWLNLRRFQATGERDVALVIDASASMEIARDGRTLFEHAVDEARRVVNEAPRGTAFLVILGGPAPEAKSAAPLTHRADVLGILDGLEPIGGSFRAHEALGVATLGLAEGTNPAKEVVVFTDGQRHGWRFDNASAWDELAEAWTALPAKPKLLLRSLETPAGFGNIALTGFETSRPLIGTDREVTLRVTVENTGTTPLTPEPVMLDIDGRTIGERRVGLLVPGQSEVAEFRHRFESPGPQVVRASIAGGDDLAADDRLEWVVFVRRSLPVLLVDGNPSGTFFERAAGYPALALAPAAGLLAGESTDGEFLMDPRVVPATSLTEADLDEAEVIVLADVPRLPDRLARRIASKAAAGTGLLVIAGPRAEPAFYNAWSGSGGRVLPARLGDEVVDAEGVVPSAFPHEALALFAEAGDLDEARVNRWRTLSDPAPGAVQAAMFSSGDPWLVARKYGNGRTLLACCAFDARAGNLPAKRSFVPLMHELTAWLAGGGVDLNVEASWNPSVALPGGGGGLSAEYFRGHNRRQEPAARRIDPAVDFDWGENEPMPGVANDGFSVRWTGMLTAPRSGEWVIEGDVDDRLELELDGKRGRRIDYGGIKEIGRFVMEAGKPVPVTIELEQNGGAAKARLFWTPPGGRREVVPPAAFSPAGAGPAEAMTVFDPRGERRTGRLHRTAGGLELAVDGPAVPGIYGISSSSALATVIPDARETVPLAVVGDPEESIRAAMNEADRAAMRSRVDLLEPRSVADIVGVMRGQAFGREIWKWLAVSAFGLFLLESALARWVSRSRRAADVAPVDFTLPHARQVGR